MRFGYMYIVYPDYPLQLHIYIHKYGKNIRKICNYLSNPFSQYSVQISSLLATGANNSQH